jgi:hypothetical protein
MISARPADSRRRLLTLTYPAISAETPEPRRLRGGQRPVFLAPVFGTRNLALLCLASRKDRVPAFDRSSLCRANIARGLRSHFAGQMARDDQAA